MLRVCRGFDKLRFDPVSLLRLRVQGLGFRLKGFRVPRGLGFRVARV